ncbi:hypothetical protein RclHR1_00500026 [Rhizophagus clarus]|uniref:BTB domain-containing protein n=1 Tax=Rhizophagus clarus TaxID=94130 RepID=A0A2Z6RJX0_9GLOM|nr:hypothetical protein RclHR1_00500026 [Rhizophagus clarus]GES97493.1 hypothetical protein GLOIN_2v1844191 [Rhizophagus clarus]
MKKGYSLEQDLRLLINNPKYSDIEILCRNGEKLYGCRAILAARSDIFDGLLYNGMKESYEKNISLPTINYSAMKIILEYTYTGSIEEKSLTKDNIIESLHAADYFQLLELHDSIMKTLRDTLRKNYTDNYSPELLSKVVEITSLTEDNNLLNLLLESVAIIPLNTIEFGRLSIAGLKYLLFRTHEKEIPFATPEYEVFRYCAILAAKQVSNDAYKTLMERLPTLELIEDSIKPEKRFISNRQLVVKELEPLVKLIDFRRIKGHILVDIIEPLEIIPPEVILNVYRHKTKTNISDYNIIRGIPFDIIWDESACGSKLIIEDNRKIIHASNDCDLHQSVRVKMKLENKGIFEWDFIVEKDCDYAWVGICSSENFNYETFAGKQSTGWVLGSSGCCYNSLNRLNYCPSFGDGTKITVHLDMDKRTCAFTVNGTKYPEVSEWNNLPSKLYPVASLYYPGRLRIQSHQKSKIP